jgi:LacI family transcriptional regulator
MQRIKLKDVARQVGLDISTVSRVLNNDNTLRITPQRRAEVLQAAQSLGYTPDRRARSLRLNRHFNIGYVFASDASITSLSTNLEYPVSRLRMYGLEQRLSTSNYLLSLLSLPRNDVGALEAKILDRHCVDGLIYSNSITEAIVQRLETAGMPTVLIDPFTPETVYAGRLNSVLCDRAYGVWCAMRHLAAQGHRRIAFVSAVSNTLRYAGYGQSICDFGLDDDPRLVRRFETPAGNLHQARAEGRRAAADLLAAGIDFTAVQAGNDATAAGVIDALQQAGRRVPEDVAVIGYDDVEGMDLTLFPIPFLTTLRDPNFEIGVRAAELLISQIETRRATQQTSLRPELVLRTSA